MDSKKWDEYLEERKIEPAMRVCGVRMRPRPQPDLGPKDIESMLKAIEEDKYPQKFKRKLKKVAGLQLDADHVMACEYVRNAQKLVSEFAARKHKNQYNADQIKSYTKTIKKMGNKVMKTWIDDSESIALESKVDMATFFAFVEGVTNQEEKTVMATVPPGLKDENRSINVKKLNMEDTIMLSAEIIYRWFDLSPSSYVFDYIFQLGLRMSDLSCIIDYNTGLLNYFPYIKNTTSGGVKVNTEFDAYMHAFRIESTRACIKWRHIESHCRLTDAEELEFPQLHAFEEWCNRFAESNDSEHIPKIFEAKFYYFNTPVTVRTLMLIRLVRTNQLTEFPVIDFDEVFYENAYNTFNKASMKIIQENVLGKTVHIGLAFQSKNDVLKHAAGFYQLCLFDMIFHWYVKKRFFNHLVVEPNYKELLQTESVLVGKFMGDYVISVRKERTYRTRSIPTMISLFLRNIVKFLDSEDRDTVKELHKYMFEQGVFHRRPSKYQDDAMEGIPDEVAELLEK